MSGGPALPAFVEHPDTEFAILPEGIYEATVPEIRAALVDPFVASSRRAAIFDGWIRFRTLLATVVDIQAEYLDGSFVTAKQEPNDLDVSFWVRADDLDALDMGDQGRLVSLMQARGQFMMDAYIVPQCAEGAPQRQAFEFMLWTEDYWSRCRDKSGAVLPADGPRKGYLRVVS